VAASKIILGQQEKLLLGNLDSKRDWGYAPEFVEGMWRILQADQPDDYVLATNETHSIREFVEETFKVLGEEIVWTGSGVDEKGILKSSGKEVVSIDRRYFRPTEVDLLIGNPAKAYEKLGWKPKTTFKELVRLMVNSDFEKAKKRIE
jgi:GDPmannose 4,6-dehydratase